VQGTGEWIYTIQSRYIRIQETVLRVKRTFSGSLLKHAPVKIFSSHFFSTQYQAVVYYYVQLFGIGGNEHRVIGPVLSTKGASMSVRRNIFKLLGVLQIICLAITGLSLNAHGQKRILAKVEPNADAVNKSAEIYDPSTGSFAELSGQMTVQREYHNALLLPDGRTLITGGYNGSVLATAEIYDPNTRTFTATTGTMQSARRNHTATLLSSGRVLIVGGYNGSGYTNYFETFSPSTGMFTQSTNLTLTQRAGHTATLLSNGKVLVAGGYNGSYLSSAELYDPSTDSFKLTTGGLTTSRQGHTATLLSNGKVLIVGGYNSSGPIATAELYDPNTNNFSTIASGLSVARRDHTATLLADGTVLIAGGYNGSYLDSAEIYDPSSNTFASVGGSMATARRGHASTLLSNGKVLISGGENGSFLSSAELYNPQSRTFAVQSNHMSVARGRHSATVLAGGQVLLAGGQNSELLVFDTNQSADDNFPPNIVFSADSSIGWVAYTGSGTVVAFATQTGKILKRIHTGGYPTLGTLMPDGKSLALVSALSNKIFIIDTTSFSLKAEYSFADAVFGFGSALALSPDGFTGYISSTGSGEVIKFNLADGMEVKRLTGLRSPAQITVTPDGTLLLVVDTGGPSLIFADASLMTQKYTLDPTDSVPTASFNIHTKAILDLDGYGGMLACLNLSGSSGVAIIFKTSTAEVLHVETNIGYFPISAALTPDGRYWVVLDTLGVNFLPAGDPAALRSYSTQQMLGTSNIAISPDSKSIVYTSSSTDGVFQQDVASGGVNGFVLVGDNPDKAEDQPSSVAITPDGNIVAVLEFVSNNIDLLTDIVTLDAPKYEISGDTFTGITLVNLSNEPAHLSISVLDRYGRLITEDTSGVDAGFTNPLEWTLNPNEQISKAVADLFAFDITKDQVGRLTVSSDNRSVVGMYSIGQIAASWFGYYLNSMDSAPLFDKPLHDWIMPELFRNTDDKTWTVKLEFTNANYTAQIYDVRYYSKDGGLRGEKASNTAYYTNWVENSFTDLFTASANTGLLFVGGVCVDNNDDGDNLCGVDDAADADPEYLNSALLYDEDSGIFSSTATMVRSRSGHSATLLNNGKVLVAGGKNSASLFASASLYDIAQGTFTQTDEAMTVKRYRHTATLLENGQVLMAGGQNSESVNDTAELYDPKIDTFAATAGTMTTPRDAHTATRLRDGKVLLAGGLNGDVVSDTAEFYDPMTGLFTATGAMTTPRAFHTATLLSNGKVLIVGGYNGTYLNSADVYDPLTGTFTPTAGTMTFARKSHTATLMSDGKVLIAGGTLNDNSLNSVEIYDPSTNSFSSISSTMIYARSEHTASLLANGNVLLVGGYDSSQQEGLKSAEIYDPVTHSFEISSSNIANARQGHTVTYLNVGAEGYIRAICGQGLLSSELYQANKDGGLLNGIDVDDFAGVNKLYVPQFANSSEYKTILSLINTNGDDYDNDDEDVDDALVTITLHAADGQVLGTPVSMVLLSGQKYEEDIDVIFQQDPSTQNTSGWIEIESSLDRVVGSIRYTNSQKSLLTSFELLGRPLKDFALPIAAEDSDYQTGVAILNPNSATANVTLELWTPDGKLAHFTTVALEPGTRTALYLNGWFPQMEPMLYGNVRVHSDMPVYGIGQMNDRALHFLSAVPMIPFP